MARLPSGDAPPPPPLPEHCVSELHPLNACSGRACAIANWAALNSAGRRPSAAELSIFFVPRNGSRLSSMVQATVTPRENGETASARSNWRNTGCGSSASGTHRFCEIWSGCSTKSFGNSIRRSRVGPRQLALPPNQFVRSTRLPSLPRCARASLPQERGVALPGMD